jgi:hypothetical protein
VTQDQAKRKKHALTVELSKMQEELLELDLKFGAWKAP